MASPPRLRSSTEGSRSARTNVLRVDKSEETNDTRKAKRKLLDKNEEPNNNSSETAKPFDEVKEPQGKRSKQVIVDQGSKTYPQSEDASQKVQTSHKKKITVNVDKPSPKKTIPVGNKISHKKKTLENNPNKVSHKKKIPENGLIKVSHKKKIPENNPNKISHKKKIPADTKISHKKKIPVDNVDDSKTQIATTPLDVFASSDFDALPPLVDPGLFMSDVADSPLLRRSSRVQGLTKGTTIAAESFWNQVIPPAPTKPLSPSTLDKKLCAGAVTTPFRGTWFSNTTCPSTSKHLYPLRDRSPCVAPTASPHEQSPTAHVRVSPISASPSISSFGLLSATPSSCTRSKYAAHFALTPAPLIGLLSTPHGMPTSTPGTVRSIAETPLSSRPGISSPPNFGYFSPLEFQSGTKPRTQRADR